MSNEPTGIGYSPALSQEQVDALLRTPQNEFLATAYTDLRSNEPENETTRKKFRQELQDKFDLELPFAIERVWDLPSIVLQRADDEYVSLLVEARDLFTMGYFYSCVAMCGIVGEKLVKDLMRGSLFVSVDGVVKRPDDEAFDQLERVDANSLLKFANKARLLDDEVRKGALDLIELRNQYAHARGRKPQADALKAIKKLHLLLEGTVSVLKDHEFIDGKFVPRAKT